ncbi:hypothetical protein [Kordiimonas sp. SCSIO 12610]|uniref:hypothetical protein n=1 Tax=Kordiimonas sp. SCSIO 12610 TaxID=2829597 RepID=UPI0021092164|nr:hypothetical protein [Kordiimonas sp. SCSIO 12610]UTW54775.1 hypothetical protein KFF44_13325 [Kordiimonas sp. SCSIO 12610]
MSQKPIPLSVRLSQKDAAFIADLKEPDAITMSEKVRYLVQTERIRSEQAETFEGLYAQCEELLRPLAAKLRAEERLKGESYPVLSLMSAWLPKMIASLGQYQVEGRVQGSPKNSDKQNFGAGSEPYSELGGLEYECLMQLAVFLPALKTLLDSGQHKQLSDSEAEKLTTIFNK